ncbi:ATP-binding protein [Nocardia colli]|uniref:ATP-binding protein n=1 Tax=Nocardia colli TaxID=2545717 RepID=A0A5N0DWQ1_9NOCA|nr:ATP-binding protein [Nocardia colli]KAA8880384.1 ATP-binding protein [Nocardia colli]
MNLRVTHQGYAYQDLITGIALVDLMLGTSVAVTVDTKGFDGDRFDDLNVVYRAGRRVRIQIKHTAQDRELSKDTFSADRRSLKLDKLFDSLLHDLAQEPGTTYRVVVRDNSPDRDLAEVLKAVDPVDDPGDPLPGVITHRFRFAPESLRSSNPWKKLIAHLTDDQVQAACDHLTVDTGAPASTLDFSAPGPAERVLLHRVTEELGAGRAPNADITPERAALALAYAATGARALDGNVERKRLFPQVGLITDFGAVTEGHPVEAAVAVPRIDAAIELRRHVDAVAPAGGRVVVIGEPGVGKSWLCEQLADTCRDADWIVARHHCWLGGSDVDHDERVLTDVVIGSLLRQLERVVPEVTVELRPRFAATPEALTAAIQTCRSTHPHRNVLLIVDGLDHVDRVVGRRTNRQTGPSRLLVDQLAAIDLPSGVGMLIASQPGEHLENAAPATDGPIQLPRMSRDEVRALARKHGLLDVPIGGDPLEVGDERRIVDLVYDRSGGNALFATYLCRYATRVSPLDTDGSVPVTAGEIVHRLTLVPDTATDIDSYYAYLLDAMTNDQRFAIGTLAMCGFALSADELGEMFPQTRPLLMSALQTLAPVLTSHPGLGGLRIHHESFSRHVLRDNDEQWVTSIRESIAKWLSARGFFTDARAFRHLPELLAQLDRYNELKELIRPGFVAEAVRALQPPEALVQVVSVVVRESRARLDWPTLIACVESRKSIDTYETESLSDSIVEYADVVVSVLGADTVAERLVYEGRPTFPSQWGLRLCRAIDQAGVAAPWKAYIEAHDREVERGGGDNGSNRDGALQLALQLGALRLRTQRDDIGNDLADRVAEHLELDHDASLNDLTVVFTAGLPPAVMPAVAAAMTNRDKAAQVYLTLADLAAIGTPGLPDPAALAQEACTRAPALDISRYLRHGIPAYEILANLGTTDLEAELQKITRAVVAAPAADHSAVRQWLGYLALAHAINRSIPLALNPTLSGPGFYRAWMRYTVATIGIADDVAAGTTSPEAASTAVDVALTDLAAEAKPFTGKPRACDLYFVHPLVHETIEKSLVVVQHCDLDAVLDRLIAIGDGTTTSSNLGLPENGPLTTNDLLEILSRVSGRIGVDAIHALMTVIRERRKDTTTPYRVTAGFELAAARICCAAGVTDEAGNCWKRACLLLASYGGHKDPTISEIIDSIEDIAEVDIDTARADLAKLIDLTYLVWQHTDGRDTSHFVNSWWEKAASIDPTAAAIDGADILMGHLGFEDSRVHSAHTHLLENRVETADPVVLAALRLTVGTGWRRPDTDLRLLRRLHCETGVGPRIDSMLAIFANNIAASYDDQAMMYSSDQPKTIVTPELVDAIVRLGGSQFGIRTPRAEQDVRNSLPWGSGHRPDSIETQRHLVNSQRPIIPAGRAGAVLAARDYKHKQYRDDPTAPRWDIDALANAIGWRILEVTVDSGAEAGIDLIDDVAREISRHSDNEIFATLGEGLALRCDGTSDALTTVASYCLTLAYIRIRGGGGWRTFAGRERTRLWTAAHDLEPAIAERTLAAAVAATVDADAQRAYGITQAIVAAFAARPTDTQEGTAAACWNAAFSIIKHRLPGTASRSDHTYRPTANPDTQENLDHAMATLALATISQPMRADLRRTLLATALLLTCRPTIGQAALAHVLALALDAGRTTWLLDVLRTCPQNELSDELATELTRLVSTDWLSVHALAARILDMYGRAYPARQVTEAAPQIGTAFHQLPREHQ